MKKLLLSIFFSLILFLISSHSVSAVCCSTVGLANPDNCTSIHTAACANGTHFCDSNVECSNKGFNKLSPAGCCSRDEFPDPATCSNLKTFACGDGFHFCDTQADCTNAGLGLPAAPPVGGTGALSQSFDVFNRAIFGGPPKFGLTTIPGVITLLLPWVYVFAGLFLLVLIIAAGYKILLGANNPESVEKGKKLLTYAFAGFLIIFSSYWIVQAIEIILGVVILN